jgi:hypothetical protein
MPGAARKQIGKDAGAAIKTAQITMDMQANGGGEGGSGGNRRKWGGSAGVRFQLAQPHLSEAAEEVGNRDEATLKGSTSSAQERGDTSVMPTPDSKSSLFGRVTPPTVHRDSQSQKSGASDEEGEEHAGLRMVRLQGNQAPGADACTSEEAQGEESGEMEWQLPLEPMTPAVLPTGALDHLLAQIEEVRTGRNSPDLRVS